MASASLRFVEFLLPVISFLFVFVVIYAIMAKTEVLGKSQGLLLLLSLVLASFFIINVSLVDFVEFSASWFSVIIVFVFLTFLLLAFFPGGLDFLKNKAVSWVVLGLMIAFFLVASSFIFNWTINWDVLSEGVHTDWFGFVILIAVAALASWVITKK